MYTKGQLAEELVLDVVEGVHCRIFNHNKHVENLNIEQELREAMQRLTDKLINMALEDTDIR